MHADQFVSAWQRVRTRHVAVAVVVLFVAALLNVIVGQQRAAAAGSPCGATINPVACENSQTSGVTPESQWDVSGAGDATIQGFATDISVNAGNSIKFKIKTPAARYTIDVYRLGYYGGNGARKITSVTPSAALPQTQPACATDPSVTLVDCGTWGVSATWSVPSVAVSGVYIAHLTRTDTGGASLIPFIVRNDSSTADIVYQTSDPTWEAYNRYGNADFYTGSTSNMWDSPSRARKISYNRPFATRGDNGGQDYLFSNEYPTIRFLERNGYDVTYISGVDTDRYGATQLKNHKIFLSVGHDEYWSQAQRTNVENARGAGVNLMFLSGNEVFWHTRYEASIDGSNTSYRTLVCYKETWDNAASDPSGEATGTWRDPRFAAAPGGSSPENALTGTIYRANSDNLPVTVTVTQGKLRVWRNTGLASMPGSSTALAPSTVGYESDEDLDNGFRPAGLVDLSTTVGNSPQELYDFGQFTTPGTTTHHITLYRATSGALVFGAGTVQWAWGLDSDHDGGNNAADARMQQFMVNMYADMGAQPQTLMSGLVAATASVDSTAPISTITSPASGALIGNGAQVSVSGTASDVGGLVAGVEVSLDGGATWHPATGTTAWSYTGIIHGNGAVKILSRATDDSANIETPSAGITVTSSCPCTIFGQATPATPDSGDATAVEVGTRFTSDTSGYVTGVRFYKASADTGTHTGTLWTASGAQLATGTFTGESGSGWQTLQFSQAVAVTAGTTYIASYFAPNGHYSADSLFFYYQDVDATPLHAESNSPTTSTRFNGVYASGHAFPNRTYQGSNYYVDPVFSSAATGTPAVVSTNPTSGGAGVPTSIAPSAVFSASVTSSSINFRLSGPSGTVAGSTSYTDSNKTATFTPSAPLANGTTYTATVTATGTNGQQMSSPAIWSFTTLVASASCPCTLFAANATPSVTDGGDRTAVSLGTQFTASVSGYIKGVRFYKSTANTGTHTGSLWSADGTRLDTATFSNETASGWQSVSFASPVAITAGTTYVVSYYAPSGHYAETDHYFDTTVTNGPLTSPVGAGTYAYGGDVFPSSTYANANYWVDPVFDYTATLSATPPTVTSAAPPSGATGVPVTATPTAVFSSSISASSLSFTLTGPSGAVSGAVSYNDATTSATFSPSASLAAGINYTATISATGANGAVMTAPYSWTFTTATAAVNCPCTLFAGNATPAVVDSGDRSAVSLGVQFSSSVAGYVTGVRFYKASGNTGVHTGSLWSATGTRLATATFTGESTSGWQSVSFSAPVAVTPGVSYVASYYAPVGRYSEDVHYFDAALTNGPLTAPTAAGTYAYGGDLFPTATYANANYWVDPIFATSTAAAPTVTSTTPVPGATDAGVTSALTATFSASVDPTSISFVVTGSNGAVSGATSYDDASKTATFTLSTSLAASASYTARVSAIGTNGAAMSSPQTWSFTTAAVSPTCPCTLFDAASAPTDVDSGDSSAISIGTRFSSSVAGSITGLRFYKSANNAGAHTGRLWSTTGALLATGTFTNETASGWQSLQFSNAVSVAAGTDYVVSYYAPSGHYSEDDNYFTAPVSSPPLYAAAGLYSYGGDVFPSTSYANANYWVDPIFSLATAPPLDTTPPTITGVTSSGSGTSATVTWTTDEAATSRVDYGTSSTNLNLNATVAGLAASHSVPMTGLTPNTRYYYRVTSADAAGNSATSPATSGSPASYAPSTTPLTDATAADFGAGTASSTYIAANGDGEVVLAPTVAQEFSGTTLPTGWTSSAVVTGGTSTVSGGSVTVSGANLSSTATYTNGKSLELTATLGKSQSIGWVGSSNANVKISFTVNASNQLIANVNDGFLNNVTGVAATGWTGGSHKFRLEWTSSSATFYLDDVQKYTHAFSSTFSGNLKLLLNDSVTTDAGLVVDWLRVGPYAASGTFTSRVFDAQAPVIWDGLSWDATVPTGATLTVKVRTGNTATPDASWTAFATIASSGTAIGQTKRYVQYQLTLTSTGSRFTTAQVRSVTAAFHL